MNSSTLISVTPTHLCTSMYCVIGPASLSVTMAADILGYPVLYVGRRQWKCKNLEKRRRPWRLHDICNSIGYPYSLLPTHILHIIHNGACKSHTNPSSLMPLHLETATTPLYLDYKALHTLSAEGTSSPQFEGTQKSPHFTQIREVPHLFLFPNLLQ